MTKKEFTKFDYKEKNLFGRHRIEQNFFNKLWKKGDRGISVYKWGLISQADDFAFRLLGNLKGKKVIDFGCGGGQNSIRLAKEGAIVFAFDISEEAVKATRRLAVANGLGKKVIVERMAAEKLNYNSNSIDLIFGTGILHHTDLDLSKKEICRILKKRGRAVFLEPLGHNPFINLFRLLTPSKRTPTEKPLRFQDIENLGKDFNRMNHREFCLLSLLAILFIPLKNKKLFEIVSKRLTAIDNFLCHSFPFLRKYFWIIVIELVK